MNYGNVGGDSQAPFGPLNYPLAGMDDSRQARGLSYPLAGVENSLLHSEGGDNYHFYPTAAGSSSATVTLSATGSMTFLAPGDSSATINLQGVGWFTLNAPGDSTATVSFGGPPPVGSTGARRIAATEPRSNRIRFATAPWFLRRVSSRQPTTRRG